MIAVHCAALSDKMAEESTASTSDAPTAAHSSSESETHNDVHISSDTEHDAVELPPPLPTNDDIVQFMEERKIIRSADSSDVLDQVFMTFEEANELILMAMRARGMEIMDYATDDKSNYSKYPKFESGGLKCPCCFFKFTVKFKGSTKQGATFKCLTMKQVCSTKQGEDRCHACPVCSAANDHMGAELVNDGLAKDCGCCICNAIGRPQQIHPMYFCVDNSRNAPEPLDQPLSYARKLRVDATARHSPGAHSDARCMRA